MKLKEILNVLEEELEGQINEVRKYYNKEKGEMEYMRDDRDPDNENKRINEPKNGVEKKIVKMIKKSSGETVSLIEELPNQIKNLDNKFVKFFVIYFENEDIEDMKLLYLGTESQFTKMIKELGGKTTSKKTMINYLFDLIKNDEIKIKSKDLKDEILNGNIILNKDLSLIILN